MQIVEKPDGFQIKLRSTSISPILLAFCALVGIPGYIYRLPLLSAPTLMGWVILLIPITLLLWAVIGKEIIDIDRNGLSVKYNFLGLGPIRQFDRRKIRDLRMAALVAHTFVLGRRWIGYGNIAFDYDDQTYRFASALNDNESGELLDKIKSF